MKLWGFYKAIYNLKDLGKWLERKQKEAQSDQKGNNKASVKTRSQKGKRDDASEGDDSTSFFQKIS